MLTGTCVASAKDIEFAPREINIETRPDGTLVSARSPRSRSRCRIGPSSIFFRCGRCKRRIASFLPNADRMASGKITYRETCGKCNPLGQRLIELGAKPGDRLAILSGNSIEHAVIMFAAMAIGVVVAPVSPNYSLMPGGISRLKDVGRLLEPFFVFGTGQQGIRSCPADAGVRQGRLDHRRRCCRHHRAG